MSSEIPLSTPPNSDEIKASHALIISQANSKRFAIQSLIVLAALLSLVSGFVALTLEVSNEVVVDIFFLLSIIGAFFTMLAFAATSPTFYNPIDNPADYVWVDVFLIFGAACMASSFFSALLLIDISLLLFNVAAIAASAFAIFKLSTNNSYEKLYDLKLVTDESLLTLKDYKDLPAIRAYWQLVKQQQRSITNKELSSLIAYGKSIVNSNEIKGLLDDLDNLISDADETSIKDDNNSAG